MNSYSTLQEHQTISTNATVSKVSDFSVLMVVYEKFFLYFQLRLNFSPIYIDGSDIYRFLKVQVMWVMI